MEEQRQDPNWLVRRFLERWLRSSTALRFGVCSFRDTHANKSSNFRRRWSEPCTSLTYSGNTGTDGVSQGLRVSNTDVLHIVSLFHRFIGVTAVMAAKKPPKVCEILWVEDKGNRTRDQGTPDFTMGVGLFGTVYRIRNESGDQRSTINGGLELVFHLSWQGHSSIPQRLNA